jgi:hypothetical protein
MSTFFIIFVIWIFRFFWRCSDRILEIFVVLSIDNKVENWLEVSVTDSFEVHVDGVHDIVNDGGILWIDILLICFRNVECLNHLEKEISLFLDDILVDLILCGLLPVILYLHELGCLDHTGHF